MSRQGKQIHFWVDETTFYRLKELSKVVGKTMTEIMNILIRRTTSKDLKEK